MEKTLRGKGNRDRGKVKQKKKKVGRKQENGKEN